MQQLRRSSRRTEPAGFTLFELMVAMGVLLLAVGMVWPVLLGFYERSILAEAGQSVRETLTKSRLSAIDNGQQYLFLFEPSGRNFLMVPAEGVEKATEQVAQATSMVYTVSGELPEGLKFIHNAENEAGSVKLTEEMIGSVSNAGKLASTRWSDPAVFYPDGSSSGIYFEIENEQRQYFSVSVRGLTGATSVSEITVRSENTR